MKPQAGKKADSNSDWVMNVVATGGIAVCLGVICVMAIDCGGSALGYTPPITYWGGYSLFEPVNTICKAGGEIIADIMSFP